MNNEIIREKIVNILGLETDQFGSNDMFIIRDGNGKAKEGVDFSEEVDEILSIISTTQEQALAEYKGKMKQVLHIAIDEAPLPNFEEDNYDAGFVAGLLHAKELLTDNKIEE